MLASMRPTGGIELMIGGKKHGEGLQRSSRYLQTEPIGHGGGGASEPRKRESLNDSEYIAGSRKRPQEAYELEEDDRVRMNIDWSSLVVMPSYSMVELAGGIFDGGGVLGKYE